MSPIDYSEEDSMLQSMDQYSESGQEGDDYDKSIAKGGVTTPFPWKLHDMLDEMAEKGEHSVVTWQPHGRAFMVHQPKEFVNEIMPHYFNQTKYASFQRQLNLYGFSRLSHGQDKGAYYHMAFVRGERGLCRNMIRQKIKGTKVRRSLAPEEEPNFYLPHWATTRGVVVDGVTVSPEQVKPVKEVILAPPAPTPKPSTQRTKKTSKASSKAKGPASPVASLVSMMMDVPKASVQTLPVLPVRKPALALAAGPSTESQQTPTMPLAGDLLFFEGRPFRYLEHLEELPPVSSDNVVSPHAAQLRQHHSYKDNLQSMINSIVMDSSCWQHDTAQRNVCSV